MFKKSLAQSCSIFFVLGSFAFLLAETKNPTDFHQKILLPTVPGLRLHLFADQGSDVLRSLRFGERLIYDSLSLGKPDPDWYPVRLEDGLAGFVSKKYILVVPRSKYLSTLVKEADNRLSYAKSTLAEKQEITDTLFSLFSHGEFTGDDFIYLRAKAGYSLKKTIDFMNENKVKPDEDPNTLEFLKRHQSKLLFDYSKQKYFVDSNFFWKLIESYPKTKHSEYAAYLATETTILLNCQKDDLRCKLENLRRGKLRYVSFFPSGNYSVLYKRHIRDELIQLTKDKDAIPCYRPISEGIKQEIGELERIISEFPPKDKKEMFPYVRILKAECNPKHN